MSALPRSLAVGALLDTGVVLLVLALGGAAIAAVEGAEASHAVGLLVTLAPAALGVASGARFGRARVGGAVDGWMALGGRPLGLLLPLALLAALAGLVTLIAPLPTASVPLPAPVDATATVWWDGGWVAPPGSRWQTPPGDLGLTTLVSRWWADAPEGARATVDGAELLRRVWFALACPLGVCAGAWVPLRDGRRRSAVVARGAFAGAAGAAVWMLVGALAVAACA